MDDLPAWMTETEVVYDVAYLLSGGWDLHGWRNISSIDHARALCDELIRYPNIEGVKIIEKTITRKVVDL